MFDSLRNCSAELDLKVTSNDETFRERNLDLLNQESRLSKNGTPYLLLPIEIKVREYMSQIQVAIEASKRGFEVYLGSHAAINLLLMSVPSINAIYFDKEIPAKSKLTYLKRKGVSIWVMDPELSPIHSLDILTEEIIGRVYSLGMEEIDRFLVSGPNVFQAARSVFGLNAGKVVLAGWPRFDLSLSSRIQVHSDSITKIQGRFGSFVLFASSFGNNRDPMFTSKLKNFSGYRLTPFRLIENQITRYEKYKHTIRCLRKWDEDSRIPRIIVRPHAGESMWRWRKDLRGLKKTYISADGDIIPWIHASSAVLHAGSTVAIQSRLAEKKTIFLPDSADSRYASIANGLSPFLATLNQPPNLSPAANLNPDYSIEDIEDILYLPDPDATSFVVDEMTKFHLRDSAKISKSGILKQHLTLRALRRLLGLIRDEIVWNFGLTNVHPQSVSIPRGLGIKEIKNLKFELDTQNRIKARRLTINLWQFKSQI